MSEFLFNKQEKCLLCENEFETKKVKLSKCSVDSRDSDFCVHYKNVSPYLYEINVCPKCGYAFTDNFGKIKVSSRDKIFDSYVKKVHGINLCGEREIQDSIKAFKLAVLCAELNDEPDIISAGLCMRIAWLYRYSHNPFEENRFLEDALKLFDKVYETENIDHLSMSESQIIYLIAELNLRLNNYDDSRKWFGYLFAKKDADRKVIEMGRSRWAEYRTKLESVKDIKDEKKD